MRPTANELSALTRMFSAAVFREMVNKGRSATFARLLHQTRFADQQDTIVGEVFDSALDVLKVVGQRDEYVYRSALINKILLGRHSLNTASALSEFRVGLCRADLVILNGTATAYEIKSERDSVARLVNQVESYRKVFASVNVVVPEEHIRNVRSLVSQEIGILCLNRRCQIAVERKVVDCPEQISPPVVFDSLRLGEAQEILMGFGVEIPRVPNTQRHHVMRQLFFDLDPARLHAEMVKILKQSRDLRHLKNVVVSLPISLRAAALATTLHQTDFRALQAAVATPLKAVRQWA